jgi:putative NADH-flavin reductase
MAMVILTTTIHALTVAICGATGGLGRELCQQGVERDFNTIAIVRRTTVPILVPNRDGRFVDGATRQPIISHPRLSVTHYDDMIRTGTRYDALILALGGKPFEKDNTTQTVQRICQSLSSTCRRVCLISAFGVEDPDITVQWMTSWYLRDVYKAKAEQEGIVQALRSDSVDVLVIRPRALSYSPTPLSTTRENLARHLLTWCKNGQLDKSLAQFVVT